MTQDASAEEDRGYAVRIADDSYRWYRSAAIRSRRMYRTSEIATVVVSAAIPLVAVVWPGRAVLPAVLGSIVVIVTGLRGVYAWHENYLRFSGARELVEAERRRYRTGAGPYGDPAARDRELVEAVTRIEQDEMRGWVTVQSSYRRVGAPPPVSEPAGPGSGPAPGGP